ncbi:hypothetical protein AcW1_008790 [Taiwanofungus camphoratus]|nr:hypothetical protein AcW1_008790 [Antrodia cinnamomea]
MGSTVPTPLGKSRPNFQKLVYQSRLHEGDAYCSEASECLRKYEHRLRSHERLSWRARLDALNAERARLVEYSACCSSVGSQLEALSKADKYKSHAKDLFESLNKRYASLVAKSSNRAGPHGATYITTSNRRPESTVYCPPGFSGASYSTTLVHKHNPIMHQRQASGSSSSSSSSSRTDESVKRKVLPGRYLTDSPEPISDIYSYKMEHACQSRVTSHSRDRDHSPSARPVQVLYRAPADAPTAGYIQMRNGYGSGGLYHY